jgi:hypothetical protein
VSQSVSAWICNRVVAQATRAIRQASRRLAKENKLFTTSIYIYIYVILSELGCCALAFNLLRRMAGSEVIRGTLSL